MSLSTLANWAQVLSVVPLLAGLGAIYHRLNCQHKGCRRLGHPSREHYCAKHAHG